MNDNSLFFVWVWVLCRRYKNFPKRMDGSYEPWRLFHHSYIHIEVIVAQHTLSLEKYNHTDIEIKFERIFLSHQPHETRAVV